MKRDRQYSAELADLIFSFSAAYINMPVERINDAINEALGRIGEFAGVDRCYLFQFNDDGRTMTNTNEWCRQGIESRMGRLQNLSVEELPWLTAQMKLRQVIHATDVGTLPSAEAAEQEHFQKQGIKALLVVPMMSRDSVIGFVGFDSVRRKVEWSDESMKLLEITANIFGNALDRKRAEELLRETEQRYRDLLENAVEGIFQSTPEGRFIRVNRAFALMTGFDSPEEMVATYTDIARQYYVDPEERRRYRDLLDREGEAVGFETKIFCKDGAIIWVRTNTRAVRDAKGAVRYYEGMVENITERKRAEEALEKSEARYRGIFDHANDAIFLMQGERFMDCNERALTMFGSAREDIIGKPPYRFSPQFQPDGQNSVAKALARTEAALSGKPQSFEWKHRRPDGTLFDADVSLNRIELGGTIYVQAIVRDITERKRAEGALKNSEQHLRDILDYLPDATFVVGKDGKVVLWNKAMTEITGMSPEEILGKGDYAYAIPFYSERRPVLVDLAMKPTEKNFRQRYPSVRRDGDTLFTEVFMPTFRGKGAYFWVKAKPLKDSSGKIIGAIESVRDITEQKEREKELRRAHDITLAILERAPFGVFVIGEGGLVEYANPAMALISGITVEQIKGINVFELPTYDAIGVTEKIRGAFKGQTFTFGPVEYTSLQGGKTTVRNFVGIPLEEGEGKKVLVFVEDLTERKRVEDLLAKERETFKQILEKAPYGVLLSDESGRFLFVSKEFTRITGFSTEDIPTGKEWLLKAYPDVETRRDLIRSWKRDIAEGGVNRVARIRCKDGTEKEIDFRPTLLEDGRSITMIADITGKRQAEELFRTLATQSPVAVYISQDGRFVYVNPEFQQITGYKEHELLGKLTSDLVLPDDRPLARDRTIQMLRGERITGHEMRVHDETGKVRWVLETVASIQYQGKRALLGTFLDITARKQAEALLRESEERYRILTEKSIVGVYLVQDDLFRYVNPAFALIYGYEPDEMIDKLGLFDTAVPDDRSSVIEMFRQMVQGDMSSIQYEFRILTKDMLIRHVEVHGARVVFNGKPAVLGTLLDITDRKEYEERLKVLSMIDELTGLQNRRGFFTLAEQQMKIALRTGRKMLLFYLDLDGMKWINDTFGHAEGDKALIGMAVILRKTFRESDILGRVGGDEFAALVVDSTEDAIAMVQDRLRRNAELHTSVSVRPFSFLMSVGIAQFDPASPCSMEELMSRADALMYLEKKRKYGQ